MMTYHVSMKTAAIVSHWISLVQTTMFEGLRKRPDAFGSIRKSQRGF
jgi:hypothetical protein